MPAINKKIAQLNELIKYKLTNDEINRKVDHENALRLKYGDRLAFRTSLTADNNRPLSEAQKQQESLAQVNLANRRINAERVRKSQLAERAKMRQVEEALARGEAVQIDPSSRVRTRAKFIHDVNEDAVALAAKKAATSAALAAALGASKEADATNGRSASITPNGTPRLLASRPAVLPHVAKVQAMQSNKDKNGMPTFHRPLMDDDVIGALDLDIDVEI